MSGSCLVLLTDTLYLPGTIRTITSWQRHNPHFPVIVLSRDEAALQAPQLKELSNEQVLIDPAPYSEISPYKKSRSKRHAETFYKFEAFRDFGFERNIYLDSDILCLREAPDLVAPSSSPLHASLDTGFKKTRGYKGHLHEINSGVLSIHRSIQGTSTIEQLKEIARSNPGRSGYNSGDQGIINKWIHDHSIELKLLSPEYNLIKKDYSDTSGLSDCRLLHFCSRKPWVTSGDTPSELETLWHHP